MNQVSEKDKRRFGLIGFVALIMVGFIYLMGESMIQESEMVTATVTGEKEAAEFYMRAENEAFSDPHVMPVENMKKIGKGRSMGEYYDRRAYAGAPPIIPHKVSSQVGKDSQCLSCHKNGGYVQAWRAYAPVTPHADFQSCRQCHVPQNNVRLFAATNWKSVNPPKLGRSALPSSPPPIPHTSALRTNCLACHYGAAVVDELKTDHPERQNCRQCHVFQMSVQPFARVAQ